MYQNFRLPVLFVSATILLASCKKDNKEDNNNSQQAAQIATHTEDQSRISSELDGVANDVNFTLESEVAFSGKQMEPQGTSMICGATYITDTISNPRTITITYNGLNCAQNHFRTGSVVLSIPAGVRWKDQGAQVTVSFNNFRITRVSDNKSITINGSQMHTNVTGGLLWQLPVMNQIVHTVSSNNMSILFHTDSSQRNWSIARKRTFNYTSGNATLQITGNHTIGNDSGVAEWGTNRFGQAFTSSITQPLTLDQNCSFRLTSGQVKHQGFATATVTFGLDSNGNPTGCPGNNQPYYYKIVWIGPGGNTHTAIHPY